MRDESGPERGQLELVPVLDSDVDEIYEWSLDRRVAQTWRYRGTTPPPEIFRRDLWNGVLAQYLCRFDGSGQRVCLVSIYNANLSSGRAYLSCIASPRFRGSGVPLLAIGAMLSHAFATWPFHKIYIETSSIAIEQYASALVEGFITEEARLLDYERFGEETADLIYLSTDRQAMTRMTQRYGPLLRQFG